MLSTYNGLLSIHKLMVKSDFNKLNIILSIFSFY